MDYEIVFDAAERLPEVHKALPLVIFPIVTFWNWWNKRSTSSLLFAWGALIVFAGIETYIVIQWLQVRNALVEGRAHVVEGPVQTLPPTGRRGPARERFAVGAITFTYSDSKVGPGLNVTRSRGGPDVRGRYVRIHWLRLLGDDAPVIARLEVAR